MDLKQFPFDSKNKEYDTDISPKCGYKKFAFLQHLIFFVIFRMLIFLNSILVLDKQILPCYNMNATQVNNGDFRGCIFFLYGKNAYSVFAFLGIAKTCVAAIGVMRFSVRGFGCALFIWRKNGS